VNSTWWSSCCLSRHICSVLLQIFSHFVKRIVYLWFAV